MGRQNQNRPDDDDGRTIADMSGIRRPSPFWGWRSPRREEEVENLSRCDDDPASGTGDAFSTVPNHQETSNENAGHREDEEYMQASVMATGAVNLQPKMQDALDVSQSSTPYGNTILQNGMLADTPSDSDTNRIWMTKEERRMSALGALKAGLLIGLVYLVGLGLVILLLMALWGVL